MVWEKSKEANINYLSKIVNIQQFEPHPNADKMKIAHVDGYNVCMGLDEQPGLYVYFPVNSTINPNILSYCNLYRDCEKNKDATKKGFFEDNGRVTAIKLRGTPSEGFLLPYEALTSFIQDSLNVVVPEEDVTNIEFDTFTYNNKSFWISKKYIIPVKSYPVSNQSGRKRSVKRFNRVLDTQFRFHYNTTLIKKEPWAIQPNDLISLTSKIHGASSIFAYVLCRKPLTILDRISNILTGKKWSENKLIYDYLYASRSVIKNANYNPNPNPGYYGIDIWGEANKVIKPFLTKGMTIYAEIVGYTPDGKYIQKNYDYGCVPPENNEYVSEKNFKVRVYRITYTNIDGITHEFSAREVQQWCKNNGLIPVTELYYGFAKDLYPDIPINEDWATKFWERLANDKNFYMECNSPECNNKVPHEGIVIKKEDMHARAWKLKTYAFLNKEQLELDAGELNIEDNA